ncbi:uncharacterized protein GBIM_01277, partial [Gryllus bimaculatus]
GAAAAAVDAARYSAGTSGRGGSCDGRSSRRWDDACGAAALCPRAKRSRPRRRRETTQEPTDSRHAPRHAPPRHAQIVAQERRSSHEQQSILMAVSRHHVLKRSAYDYLKITAFIVVVTSIWAAMTATAEGIDWCILVSTNEIEVANVKELVHLTKLEKLDLSLNQLEELDLSEGTLLYLWSLNASFNKLRRFESQPLRLTHLTLQENMLSDVCFVSRFRSLRYLNLSFNRITYIPDDVFQNLTDLYFLDLKNNQITNADFVLLTTKVLHTLVLSNNRISKLPVKSFRYSKIVELYLDNNTLTNVDFLIYSNAAEINLNDNQLSTLNGKLFENKNKLKVLNVSGMKLTSVDFITSIPSLISVGMESNNVSCLPKGFLKNYKTLKEWFLLDNPLEDLICPMSSEWTVQEMCNISASDNKVQILMKDVNINDIMRCVLDRRNIFEDCEQKCNFASHTLFPPLLIFVSTLFNVI